MAELIQPVQQGQTLLDDILNTQPAIGQLAVWWLGQSGYAFKTARHTFYVDLYLSEHLTAKYADTPKPHIRMTVAPLRGSDLASARLIFGSHKHSDHIDPVTLKEIMAIAPARLVLPAPLADHAVSLGVPRERLITTQGDETLKIDEMTVHIVPSAHPDIEQEASGHLYIGFIFEVDGVTFYHSGDTVVYDGLAERLSRYELDLAFLPINGTDEQRKALHVPPNMNIAEALELAQGIGRPVVIPHHYDMFTFNTVDVQDFVAQASALGQPHRVLQCGERFIWSRT